jgi:cytoskeletal protein RodZ
VGEFGDKFRKAREKKEISLDDVSNVTKISARMLQAIEQEHFDQLPGGVFNKGFIRAYAKHLGLDSEEAVTDYLVCLRQAQIDAQEIWEPERPRIIAPPARPVVPVKPRAPEHAPVAVKQHPPTQVEELPDLQLPRVEHVRLEQKDFAEHSPLEIPWRIVAIAAVVVVLGIILWARRSHNANTAATSAPNTVQAKNSPQPVSTAAPVNQASTAAALSSGAALSTPPSTSVSQPPSHPPTPATAATAASEKKDPEKKTDDKSDVTVRTPTKANSKREKPAPVLTLVIRATETSWISVLADGQPASQETLIAPAHTSIRASHEIVAKVGNAAGVTFLWNGKEIPAAGAESEVKTFIFDSNGMHVGSTTQTPGQNQ